MLVGFAALSPLGVEPAWVAAAAAVVLSGYALVPAPRRRRATVARAAHLSFAVFVLCLGVVVAGLTDTFLGDLVARRWCPDGDGLGALAGDRPARHRAGQRGQQPAGDPAAGAAGRARSGVTAVLAALVGLGVGSGLTYTGSLANLLWRRTLLRRGGDASAPRLPRCSSRWSRCRRVVVGGRRALGLGAGWSASSTPFRMCGAVQWHIGRICGRMLA